MRFAAFAALILLSGAVQAQTPLTGTTAPIGSPNARAVTAPRAAAPPPAAAAPATPATAASPVAAAPAHRRGQTLQDRFDAANVTHDGHLTQEQARAHMPSVARDFAKIDTANQGYVTVDQIREYRRATRAAHRAAKKAAATPAAASAAPARP